MENHDKKTKIVVFGTFDILHYGHLKFLEEAKKQANEDEAELIVIVSRDSSTKEFKGKPPIFSETHRKVLIEALKTVDKALLGHEGNKIKIIEEIKPDIIVLGYDQWPDIKWLESELKKRNLHVKIVRLEKYGNEILNSSSKIIQKIFEKYSNQFKK